MSLADRVQLPAESPGTELYRVDAFATITFVVAAGLAAAIPSVLRIPFAVLSCILFAAGTVAFLWAYAKALGRSREQDVSVSMIYGMSVAPAPVRWRFHGLTFVQSVAAIVTASIHPFTAQAFGILAPMLGLGLAGLWAAQHGTFAERTHGREKARDDARQQVSRDQDQAKESNNHG